MKTESHLFSTDIEIEREETYEQPNKPTQMLVWVESDDFEAVDEVLADDPAVTNPTVLADMDDRRFYQVNFTSIGDETNLMPEFIAVGNVLQSAVGTDDGWWCRARFPHREAFEHIYQFCVDHNIDFTFERLYEETARSRSNVSLTEPQQQILIEAGESGYLEIPRTCSLVELADRLGLSDSSASERFRRGVNQLIQQAVLTE